MTKNEIMDFFDGISLGSDCPLTLDQFICNREKIISAIESMKKFYRESPLIHADIRKYYESDFTRIDEARSDQKLLVAIECLRISLELQ